MPLTLSTADLQEFRKRYLTVTARLAPGVTVAQATAAVDRAELELNARYPVWGNRYGAQVHLVSDDLVGDVRARLFILLGAVSFVFLIACVNVANLLLARAGARAREMAIRVALGAERRQLLRQLLTESAVLSSIGGVTGVALAFALVRGLVAASPPNVPRVDEAGIDGVVLLFTLATATLCSLLVGLLPALRSATPTLVGALREGGRGVGETRARERSRGALVAGEVALALALLTGAGPYFAPRGRSIAWIPASMGTTCSRRVCSCPCHATRTSRQALGRIAPFATPWPGLRACNPRPSRRRCRSVRRFRRE